MSVDISDYFGQFLFIPATLRRCREAREQRIEVFRMRTQDDTQTPRTGARADPRPERAELLREMGLGALPSSLDLEWFLDRFDHTGRE
ncbi:MAG: hypothetical protein ACP5DX_00730 [Paracoccaceae bacterium]